MIIGELVQLAITILLGVSVVGLITRIVESPYWEPIVLILALLLSIYQTARVVSIAINYSKKF
jgi:hypothetical protein